MKKNEMKMMRVEPRGVVPHVNGEAARCGEAAAALNVREQEASLQVTGQPMPVGTIAVGSRLLLIADGHYVTCRDNTVMIDGETVLNVDGAVVGAHAVGALIVVVTNKGFAYLSHRDGGWVVLDPADAVPQLSFGASTANMGAEIAAYTFVEPYRQWVAPLADADTAALGGMMRGAWNALHADAAALGRHTSPMLVRWAVRLKDGNYLWMSDPVRVGDETLVNADRITAMVNTSDGQFTGTQATELRMVHYGLEIEVTRDISASWLPLVSSIDVFATSEAELLSAGRRLEYRCLTRTTGPREHVLEMGLARRDPVAIATQLNASTWRLVARAEAGSHVNGADFLPPVEEVTLTNGACASIGQSMQVDGVVCSATAGGRLYCCTTGGDIVVSASGNALVEVHRRSVLGCVVLSMAVVTRPLYSGGFGRYPVYLFTSDGIFAVAQSATGTLGEARLVDRTVIAAGVAPVEGGGDIWFVSRHHHLCRLSGARVEVCHRDADYTALAWCNGYQELWMLRSQGHPVVMMKSGGMSERTVDAKQLYCDSQHAVAVDAAGQLLDLEQEVDTVCPVRWLSHPVALDVLMGKAVRRVVWHMKAWQVELTLRVTGQRGVMCRDEVVSVITVAGEVEAPLATPAVSWPARTLRLEVNGVARSGSLVLPTGIFS